MLTSDFSQALAFIASLFIIGFAALKSVEVSQDATLMAPHAVASTNGASRDRDEEFNAHFVTERLRLAAMVDRVTPKDGVDLKHLLDIVKSRGMISGYQEEMFLEMNAALPPDKKWMARWKTGEPHWVDVAQKDYLALADKTIESLR